MLYLGTGVLAVTIAIITAFFGSQVTAQVPTWSSDQLFDYEWKKVFHYTSLFESLDGFTVATKGEKSQASVDGSQLLLQTEGKIGSYASIAKQPLWQGVITFSQKSNFRTTFVLTNPSNAEFYAGIGSYMDQGYGFKIAGGNLYGYTNDGVREKTVLLQSAKGDIYTLEARYEPTKRVTFLVNSTEKGVLTENLPSSGEIPNRDFMFMRLLTTDDASKVIQSSYFEYLQARNVLK